MKRSKMEQIDSEMFKDLTADETRLVAGGAREATGEATWSEASGADGKVDIKWTF